ncbi:MAG: hypothetical protein ACLVCW_08920 [Campylobacter sp.]
MKFETVRKLAIVEWFTLPFGFLYSLQTAAAVNFALLSAKFCSRHFSSCACFVGAVEFDLLVLKYVCSQSLRPSFTSALNQRKFN